MKTISAFLCLAITALATGCGSSADNSGSTTKTVAVRGALALDQRATSNAHVIALSRTNRGYSAPLDAHGGFALQLPASSGPYRIIIANAAEGGRRRAVGHLVVRSAKGPKAWVSFKTDVNLRTLRVPQTAATASSPVTAPATIRLLSESESADAEGQDGQDQQGEVEEQFDDLCGEHDGNDDNQDDDVALEAEGDEGDLTESSSSGDDQESGPNDEHEDQDGDQHEDQDELQSCGG